MKYFRLCLLFIVSCFAMSAFSAQENSLYQTDYPVTDQSPEEWQRAVPGALTQVLSKISGNDDVAKSPKIQKELKMPLTMLSVIVITLLQGLIIKTN
ncbi:MAG: DUF2066 domain-containing protein [Coxiellaceae bacterium]|nr:MAG: DUF2066 domain-containing protein [Coxiellaceae bacterium]